MQSGLESFSTGMVGLVFLFGLVVLILWTLLPFAVFGVKARLDRLIEINRQVKTLLEKQAKQEKVEP